MSINIIYFISTVMFTLLVYKLLLSNGNYLNLYDYPNERKIHREKILKVGGIGIIFSCLFMLSVYRLMFEELLFEMTIFESQIFFSTIFLVIGGLIDDLVSLNAPQKLFFQLTAIFIIIKSGFILSLSTDFYINIIVF